LNLVLFLAAAWIIIFLILIRGIKSSGKAAYVLAIFPYIVLFILFGRAITLPGAIDGIIFFLRPDFGAMLKPRVWFDAVSQVFFSLAVGFGCVTMYASFNKFDHNIYRDVNIVSVVDTCTSLLAGCTIFGVLGHLKYKTGNDDIFSSTGEGAGLVFITYPDAISKFDWFPQLFALLFFLMFFVLGVGSIISMTNCVMTVIRDKFPHIKNWQAALGVTLLGFSVGIVYVTPVSYLIYFKNIYY
jgi:solute carrier family 6 amino acid transporter-like protein 5/7/9/14